jgi:H+/Cl- antiporter ClcA
VTQAPITAFIIVMEMTDGHQMVLSLMGSALIASVIGRLISEPLYPALAQLQVTRVESEVTPSRGTEQQPESTEQRRSGYLPR